MCSRHSGGGGQATSYHIPTQGSLKETTYINTNAAIKTTCVRGYAHVCHAWV